MVEVVQIVPVGKDSKDASLSSGSNNSPLTLTTSTKKDGQSQSTSKGNTLGTPPSTKTSPSSNSSPKSPNVGVNNAKPSDSSTKPAVDESPKPKRHSPKQSKTLCKKIITLDTLLFISLAHAH